MKYLHITLGGILLISLLLSCSVAAAPFAYIPNINNNNVSVIDTATNSFVTNISVGSGPYGVAVSPDGSVVYVGNSNAVNTVSVISAASNQVVYTITGITNPTGIVVSPDNSTVYVTNFNTPSVMVISTSTNQWVKTITIGGSAKPSGIAVSPDNSTVYVADNGANTVTVINTSTESITGTINVGSSPQGIAVSPDGATVYVVNQGSNNVSVINTATSSLIANVTVGSSPMGVAVTPDGSKVYVSNNGGTTVSVINTTDNTVSATVPVGTGPWGVAVTPDGSKVYVANSNTASNSVSVITTATNIVAATVPVGSGPQSFGPFIMTSSTRTAVPVITTPVYAGATSVSGTAPAGASVVLTYNGVRQAAVTATGGTWTVTVPALSTTDTLSATAWQSPNRMSSPVTATVTPAPLSYDNSRESAGTGSSGLSIATVQSITAGQPATFVFNQNPGITAPVALTSVAITFTQNLANVYVTGMPVTAGGSLPGDTVIGYFQIEPVGINPDAISQGVISFSVNAPWLANHNMDPVQVVMLRNHNNQWAVLPTTLISQSGSTCSYQATTPGFSYFAVAVQPTATGGNTSVQNATVPVAAAPVTPMITVVPPTQETKPAFVQTTLPVTTTAAPAAAAGPGTAPGIPVLPVVGGVAGIGVVGGGGFLVRRWWIRRQNPALFEK